MNKHIATLTILAALGLPACGGGVPVELRIDEFQFELSVDSLLGDLGTQLAGAGILGGGALPEIWPNKDHGDLLPDINYTLPLKTEPIAVDLTPPSDSPDYDKYKKINEAGKVVNRIEINRLVLRIEQSTLTIAVPELRLQMADEPTASPDDREAWYTLGKLPTVDPLYVGDVDFEWAPGGESFFNFQLGDDKKEFAVRALSDIVIDTAKNPVLPRGVGKLRLILVATFYIEPTQAKQAAGAL
jgi:hypothetical protein